MAAPPLADPSLPEPVPGGTGTSSASPAAGGVVSAAAKKAGDDELEHGWTGLGLPAYEAPPPAPAPPPPRADVVPPVAAASTPAPVAKEPAPVASTPAPVAKEPAPVVSAPAPVAKEPAPVAKEPAPVASTPAPVAKEPAPVASTPAPAPVKTAASALRAQPPRPAGKSGAFAAVRPTQAPPEPTPPRPVAPPPEAGPPRPSAPGPAPRPDIPRASRPHPAPAATPAPAPAIPPPPDTERDEQRTAASADPSEASDVTIEDDLGATIPDPRAFDDLTATVPMLPHAAVAPSFGLPPPDLAPPLPPEPDTGPPPYGPGAIIGDKYRLIRIIGRGGMGAVWLAHNTALDVEVAIKLMRRDRATPEAAARFTTEARAAARLGHSSIVRVFDFGETSRGDPFIVMELLHGESFGALLARKKKLAPVVAVQTLLPVAHALAAAHAKGIVHRDLKPDNILLAKDETNVVTPKVVDFGIAKLVSADVDRHFTIAGEVLGSPDYMSPEQARGEDDIDHRTDIWTFTVLLYEAVTGRRPFDGSNYNALLASIIASKPVPITELGVPEPALSAILEKGLAKERDARWQSVREMGMELAAWALEKGAEHDLAGASLAAQWLEPRRRRLFTVAGSAPPPDPAAPPEPAIPPPPPLGALAADLPKPEAPAIAHTMPPFVPRRRPWIAVAIGVVCLGLLGFGLLAGGVFQGQPEPAASAPAPTATAAAAPTVTEQPAASASVSAAPSATTSAKPATSTKRPLSPTTAPFKPKAPRVKGDITF